MLAIVILPESSIKIPWETRLSDKVPDPPNIT
jgi:hypothetical protein